MSPDSGVAFVIQMPKVREVWPNIDTHKEFGEALEEAKAAGVRILFWGCDVQPDSLTLRQNGETVHLSAKL